MGTILNILVVKLNVFENKIKIKLKYNLKI